MWYWDNMHDWGFGGFILIILLIIVVGVIVWAVLRNNGGGSSYIGPGPSRGRDPLEIAKERYAKGEITKDQFDQIKKDLLT